MDLVLSAWWLLGRVAARTLVKVLTLPLTGSQLNKLGDRLRDAEVHAPEDLTLLEEVLATYDEALECVRVELVRIGFAPTVRLKTTGTLVDKLRRSRNSRLKTVQDLAGARLVIEGGLAEQNRVRDAVTAACESKGYGVRVDDRRDEPNAGYRAVHLIVKVDGIPVEVQIRTPLQDLWAQIFERLADAWGRGIRYGAEPDATVLAKVSYEARVAAVGQMGALSYSIAALESAREAVRNVIVMEEASPGRRSVNLAPLVESASELEALVRERLQSLGNLLGGGSSS
jgi:ppGpp synthetase/RelA/SpoT-type nucleotidyltranferase